MSLVERTESEGRARPPRSLSVYDRMANPLDAVKSLGRSIAMSKMFGQVSLEQGEILALECLARRQPVLTIAETYHVIHGRLSMRADAILAKFNEQGGRHKILSRTGDKAEVELSIGGQTQVFGLTWEEAKQEPFVYNGGKEDAIVEALAKKQKLTIKSKYATPRARMQMLWARVVSDGVRAMLPGVVSGRYTPEELGDDEPAEDGGELVDAEYQIVETQTEPQPEPAPVVEAVAAAEVVQVVGTAERLPAVATTQAESLAPVADAGLFDGVACTGEQSGKIRDAFAELQLSDVQIAGVLAKRSVNVIRSLSYQQADELLAGLQIKLDQQRAQPKPPPAVKTDAEAPIDPPAKPLPPIEVAGPCQPEQEAEVKRLLLELNQVAPGTTDKFRTKLRAAGYAKIAELSHQQAVLLIQSLTVKQLDQFFAESLAPKQQPKQQEGPASAKN